MEAAQKIIREAEHQSAKTCEYCGKPGKLRKRFWFKTLCVEHALEDEKITSEEAAKELLDSTPGNADQKIGLDSLIKAG